MRTVIDAHADDQVMLPSQPKIVIVGAGPTGLGAAVRMQQLGHTNWILLEKSPEPGGLAGSVIDENGTSFTSPFFPASYFRLYVSQLTDFAQGFVWDYGGHVIFSHYKYFNEVLSGVVPDWVEHQRESWVWMHDRFIPYPLQNNIHR